MLYWLLRIFLGTTLSITPCGSVEYYVTPSQPPNKACPPGEPCYTLNEYALNYSTQLSNREDNVSLMFIGGSHNLDYTLKITNVKLLSIGSVDHKLSDIHVTNSDILIENISVLIIGQLIIRGYSKSLKLQTVTLAANSVVMDHITFHDCNIELVGENVEFNNCNLYQSTVGMCAHKHNDHIEFKVYELFAYRTAITTLNKDIVCSSEVHLKLNITKSVLTPNYNQATITIPIRTGANVRMVLRETYCSGGCLHLSEIYSNNSITIDILNSRIHGYRTSSWSILFSSPWGAKYRYNNIKLHIIDSNITKTLETGLSVNLYHEPSHRNRVYILLSNCTISGNHHLMTTQLWSSGSGDNDLWSSGSGDNDDGKEFSSKSEVTIEIKESTIINNHQVLLVFADMEAELNCTIIITHCKFEGNFNTMHVIRVPSELAIPYDMSNRQAESILTILLRNVTIQDNSYHGSLAQVTIANVDKLTIENCNITNNNSTAVQSYLSRIVLSGIVMFVNNSGDRGGAISLHHSYLFLSDFSNISFVGNIARDVGGAIFVKQFPIQRLTSELPQCFYQFNAHTKNLTLSVYFRSNTAINGGDNLYGGAFHGLCSTYLGDDPLQNRHFLNDIFRFFNKQSTLSSVSSNPTRVCLCDEEGKPQCTNIRYIFATIQPRYPGEMFTVFAVTVGYDFGTVSGIVHSHVLHNEVNASIAQDQYIQQTSNLQCTPLNFSLETIATNTTLTIQLGVGQTVKPFGKKGVSQAISDSEDFKYIDSILLHQPVLIKVPLEDCPIGYILSTTPPYVCKCHPILKQAGISRCIISNHTGWVYRSGTVWVGATYNGNETNGFVVHQYCPYGYCKPGNTSVTLILPDRQCAFNHSGIMCGSCHGELSLALGSFKCLPCDNRYMSLLLVFGLAGILLVFFIKILNLTVSQGTINGLVFYANIVWANKSILFPNTELVHPMLHILHTFIAWVNLDLGIETCFSKGLNAYWKMWLQFAFPIYIWIITGVMIIAARYSTRASKIFGNNSVPVLATLIFLSYAKLLRTIITSLGFSILNYPQGTRVVWSFDGNVPYFGAAHLILFLVALIALLLLWLPYTTVLLTFQCLKRKSYLKHLQWINRWKPFFDAYFGQLKPKHYYWVGLQLLVRVFLLVLFAGTSAVAPRINMLAIAITCTLMMAYTSLNGLVYKKWYLSLLENSFLVNLSVFAAGALYMQAQNNPNSPVVYTVSVALAFFTFLGTVVYHIWDRVRMSYETYKRRHTNIECTTDTELRIVAGADHSRMHYREPLLDSSVQEK